MVFLPPSQYFKGIEKFIEDKSFLGVHFCNTTKKYIAKVSFNGKTKTLGKFDDPLEAAIYRDQYIDKNKLSCKKNTSQIQIMKVQRLSEARKLGK